MFCKLRGEGSHSSLPGITLNNKMILRSRRNINPVTFVQFQNKPSQIIATWEDLAATCCWPSLYFKLDIFVASFWPWWVGAKVGFVCLELLLEFHWDDPQASRKKLGTMIHSKSGKSKMYKYKNIPITFMRVCYSSYPNLWSPRLPGRSYDLVRTRNEPALAVIYQASTSALAARLSCQLFFLRLYTTTTWPQGKIRAPSQVRCSTCGPFRPLVSWTNKTVSGAHCKDEFGLVRVQLCTIRWFQYRCIKCPSKKNANTSNSAKISKKIELIAISGVEWVTYCW